MAAAFGYHSPQFSEDIAWRPAWLQPHQPPGYVDSEKDGESASLLACRTVVPQENASDGPGNQLLFKDNGSYSDCHLFLSAEDDSTTSTSGNVLHLHLHLSSGRVSQDSSGLLNGKFLAENWEANKAMTANSFPGIPAVHDNTSYPTKEVQDFPSGSKLVACCSKMSSELPRECNFIVEKNSRLGFQPKIAARKLKKADAIDAVELSIAASEALVISDMLSRSLNSEPLPGAGILEIALQVKQARNQNHLDMLESVSTPASDILDETDQLSDLDEDSMAGSYDDVGLSFTQVIVSPDDFCSERSPQDTRNSDIERQVLPFIWSAGLKTPVSDQYCTGQEKDKLIDAEDSVIGSIKNVFQNTDALNVNKMDTKDGRIATDSKGFAPKDTTARRSREEIVVRETSFFSESMETMNERRRSEHLPGAEPEIVASSSTPYNTFAGNKNAHEGGAFSQDPIRCCSLSFTDTLCSIVPSSIPSEDSLESNKDPLMAGEKFIGSIGPVGLLNCCDKTFRQNAEVSFPLKPLHEGKDCDISEFSAKGSGEPSRKLLNSLKSYSVVPGLGATTKIPLLVEKVLSENVKEKIRHPFPNKQNKSSLLSGNVDSFTVPLSTSDKHADVDGQRNNQSLDINECEAEETTSRVIKDDDMSVLHHEHEERCLSNLINNKNGRHLQTSKMTLSSDGRHNDVVQSSEQNTRKHNIHGAGCMDQVYEKLPAFSRSSLYPHPTNPQGLPKKKVRFTEAEIDCDGIEALGRLQSGSVYIGLHGQTRRRNNMFSLQKKPLTSKDSHLMNETRMIFQGLEFLLTGFSAQKEKELEALIRRCGGYVLSKIPSCPSHLTVRQNLETSNWKTPIVLSPKKVQSTKFLYGCAINTWMLNADWLLDSVQAGSALHPGKYLIKPLQASERNYLRIGEPIYSKAHSFIFNRVGILLYGRTSFCSKFLKIIKHGGGQVYKSLQRLVQSLRNGRNSVGTILVEDECSVSRHLKHCAMENNLPTMPANWMINSLFAGKLLPFKKNRYAQLHKIKMPTFTQHKNIDMSQEI